MCIEYDRTSIETYTYLSLCLCPLNTLFIHSSRNTINLTKLPLCFRPLDTFFHHGVGVGVGVTLIVE